MQQVTMVITNTGDGANDTLWFRGRLSNEQMSALESSDTEYFSSGDGFQDRVYNFPDDFDFEAMGVAFSTVGEFLGTNYF